MNPMNPINPVLPMSGNAGAGRWATCRRKDAALHRLRCFATTTACILTFSAACVDTYPPESAGGKIQGTVAYHGSAHTTYDLPALDIAAFESYPPRGTPHAGVTILNPDFSAGPLSYELRDIPVHAYFVVAVIVEDTDHLDVGSGPRGGYPHMCALQRSTGNVVVREQVPASHIDFVLYDNAGNSDPCIASATACPTSDEGAARVTVHYTGPPAAPEDVLIFALFNPFPGAPSVVFSVPGPALILPKPQSFVLSALAPKDYVVYACLDRGGDDSQGICGSEDAWVLYPDEGNGTYDFPAGEVVNLTVDLDAATVTAGTEAPGAECDDP